LLHGTLETLILKTLAHGRLHGYAIARWLEERTGDVLQIEDGSLYPALYRMEQRGWIHADWGTSELGRKAKFYAMTPAGRKRLAGARHRRDDCHLQRSQRRGASAAANSGA